MSNLFNTFGRAALVAIGLALAPAAFAQGTFSCTNGFTPIFTGVGTQNLEATCGVTCPSGQVASVNGNTVSCTTGAPVDFAPSGCKITASPSSGSTATDVILTLSCTSGTLPINVAWQGTAPAGCPSGAGAMDALSKTCTVSSVAQTTTWTVSQFSNTVGTGSNNANKSATFTFQQGGGGSYAACDKPYSESTGFYPASNASTSSIGELNDNTILVIKFTVPASQRASSDAANFSTQYSGDKVRDYVLSTEPCDFDWDKAVLYSGKKVKGRTWSNLSFKYTYGAPGSGATLIQGTTYYLSIRGVAGGGCPGGDCPYGPVSFQ